MAFMHLSSFITRTFGKRVRAGVCLGPGCPRNVSGSTGPCKLSSAINVTDEQVRAFANDGVIHLPKAFNPEWVSFMRGAFHDAMERPGAYAEFMSKGTTWSNLFDADASKREVEMFQDQIFFQQAQERVPAWATVVENSPAAEIIAKLMKSMTASFLYGHLILKRGGAEQAIPWHQDLPYWKVDGSQIGSVWIALDDMPISASVRYVRGSHNWGLFRPRHFVDASPYEGRDELPPLPEIDAMLAKGEAQTFEFDIAAGDAVCFNARIVHGSLGNPESPGRDHRRVALRFGGDDAIYCDRQGESAIPTKEVDAIHGRRHGDPLLCEAFPLVWPRS